MTQELKLLGATLNSSTSVADFSNFAKVKIAISSQADAALRVDTFNTKTLNLDNSINALNANVATLTTSNTALNANVATLTTSNAALNANVATLTTSNTALNANVATLTTSNAALSTNYNTLNNAIKTLTINVNKGLYLDTNNKTVKYGYSSITTNPTFIKADVRGTGPEWFAVVNQSSKANITSYAKGESAGITAFTPSGESSPVIFNNIVTTFMTDMSSMFKSNASFNYDISSWDTSNVTNMNGMFANGTLMDYPYYTKTASAFNQNIGSWNVSNVTTMENMFLSATSFNNGGSSSINNWNTSKVTRMVEMFHDASAFNQPLNLWNTSIVSNMTWMFNGATIFNQDIRDWNVSSVTNKLQFRINSALTLVPPGF